MKGKLIKKKLFSFSKLKLYKLYIKVIPIILISLSFIPFSTSFSKKLRKNNYFYEVRFKYKGSGEQIIPREFTMPDSLTINNVPETINYENNYFLREEEENDIVMAWTHLFSCSKMFKDISGIISIDLQNLDVSTISDMSEMFSGCTNLQYINFGNFDTSKVENMESMFYNCVSLSSLDLSRFITSNVLTMKNMFYNTKSLISLDLKNFETIKVSDMENMFFKCDSLIYINLISFKEVVENINLNNMFDTEINKLIYCINETSAPKINSLLVDKNLTNNCDNLCFKSEKKINIDKGICTENCDSKYYFEIDRICYKYNEEKTDEEGSVTIKIINEISNEITNDITNETINDENKSNILKTDNKYTTIFETDKIIQFKSNEIINTEIEKNFNSTNFFMEKKETKEEELSNKDDIIKNIQEDLTSGNLSLLLADLLNGTKKDLIAEYKDITYQITTTSNQNNNTNNNISTIDLGECEYILKDIYNINKNLSLIILKIDYSMPGLLIPVIGYEVYHPINYSKLNLSYCNDTVIKLNIPVSIDEDNIYKYDPNSDYYNDACYAYTTENGTDIILNDRINEYTDNNLSLCENNCTFNGYDTDSKKALCICEAKIKISLISEIEEEQNLLSNDFNDTVETSHLNLGTMKCVSLLFSSSGLLTNIGSYLLLFTIFIFIISLIIFYKCGYHLIENNIREILKIKEKEIKNNIDIFKINNKSKMRNTISIISNPKKKRNKKKKKVKKKIKENNKIQQLKISTSKYHINNKNIKKNSVLSSNSENNKGNMTERKKIEILKYKEIEINSLNYKSALELDKRTYFQCYFYLLKTKILVLLAFYPMDDYNIQIIKICLLFLSFIIFFSINTFFFNNSTIHQIYLDGGKYNFLYFLPSIIYSFIISYICITFIKYFSLSERNLLEIKNEENEEQLGDKVDKVKKCLLIKYIIFYVVSLIFLFFFWFYLSSFCAVYKNTQIYLIINTIISFVISMIYIIIFNLLPCSFRIISLKENTKINEYLYKSSKILELL